MIQGNAPCDITVNIHVQGQGSIFNVCVSTMHRLRVFENRVLRRVFGPKRDEVTGE
jgi:hypothetical protein